MRTRLRRFAVSVLAVIALLGAAQPAVAAPALAEQQLAWLVDASTRVPVPEPEIREHLTPALLDAIGGPAGANDALRNIGRLTVAELLAVTPTALEAIVDGSQRFLLNLTVDPAGLINFVLFGPYAPTPTSWSELDTRLRALAPRALFVASTIDERTGCRPEHAVDADTPHPLGSAFKLYVLGALSRAVTTGRLDWNQPLAIREDWKSLPSGVLQDAPAGTQLSLTRYADLMISISDNTATDHLIHTVGRLPVHHQLSRFDNRHVAANTPFLTTREFFALKGFRYPTLARAYLALPRLLRPALLPTLNRAPRDQIQPWTDPRDLDRIEWFGSPNDLCRAYTGLLRENTRSPQVGTALSIEDGNIALNRTEYPTVWFKGGSEPGLLVLSYLARTTDGRTLMTAIMLSNPTTPIDHAVLATEAFALARGGIHLATQN